MVGMLEGRKAVVTGAGRGLGRAIAARFAEAGATVFALDLPESLDGATPAFERIAVDLSDRDAEGVLAGLAARLGVVDIVAAVAGVVPPWAGMAGLDRAEWDRVFAVNVWGVAVTLKSFAEALAASGRGSAVLMASINGYRAHPDQVLYTATKHAVVGITRAAALDLGRVGVRVNALAPGPIATEALVARVAARHEAGGSSPERAMAAMGAETALGRIATEAQVAEAALFLAGDRAAGITGTVLPVECGLA